MKCPYCGEENPQGLKYCELCGENLYDKPKENVELQEATKADNVRKEQLVEKNMNITKIVGVVFGIFIIVGVIYWLFATESGRSVLGVGVGIVIIIAWLGSKAK